jgi:TonB family protein
MAEESRSTAKRSASPLNQLAALALAAVLASADLAAQIQATRTIEGRDGDVLVIDGPTRIRVVRRHQAQVRAVHDDGDKWLILMMDVASGPGNPADGNVDASYTFSEVSGWPLPRVWSASATIEEYGLAEGFGRRQGIGLRTESGLVQLMTFVQSGRASDMDAFKDPSAVATVRFRTMNGEGSMTSTTPTTLSIPGTGRSFAATEQRLRENATRSARTRGAVPGVAPVAAGSGYMQPFRVGGNVSPPRKILDVAPILPDEARRTGKKGTVRLEIVIGADGRVLGAQAVHSDTVLAEAAINAVRQWRFEVTEINGLAVPISMTVTVVF